MSTIGRRQPAFGMDSASVMSSNRRDRLLQHKRGTGRQTTRRQFGLTGKRSGITMPSHVVKDGQGFEDMDAFWNAAGSQAAIESPPGPSASSSSSSASFDAGAPSRQARVAGGGRRFARRQPATVPEDDNESESESNSASQSDDDVTDRRGRRGGGRTGGKPATTRRGRKQQRDSGSENSDSDSDGGSDAGSPARGRGAKPGVSRPARRMQFSSKFRKPKRGASKSAPAEQSAETDAPAADTAASVRRRSVAVGVSPGLALRSGGVGTHDTPHGRRDSGAAAAAAGGGGGGIDFGAYADSAGMGGYDDGGGGEDDDHHADDAAGDGYGDDASDDEPTPAASSSSAAAAASSSSRGGKSGKVTKRQVKPRSKPSKRKPAAAAARPRDWQDDDEEGDDDEGLDAGASRTPGAPPARREPILSPGGTDTRRIRKSIHPSQAEVQEALALGMRRSGRRRWNPLEYWKGEHVEYRRGEKEEVFSGARAIKEGFLTPDTVKAKRSKRGRAATKGPKQGKAGSKRSKAAAAASAGGDAEEGGGSDGEEEDDGSVRYPPAMNPRDLPKAVQLTREGHENLQVGQREGHPAYNIVCVRRAMGLKYQKLPSDPDTVTDDAATDVGMRSEARAAAAFDTPTFITGSVSVPPLCQKDEESTQHCLQIFCVVACQPKSLHVSVADKQFVLSPGDHFFVPHNTIYRLRNFSSTTGATIAFTVLKPALDDADEESAEE